MILWTISITEVIGLALAAVCLLCALVLFVFVKISEWRHRRKFRRPRA